MSKKNLGIIGIGNMGLAIYEAVKDDFQVYVYDPYKTNTVSGISFADSIETLSKVSDVILICVKPDTVVKVLKEIKSPKTILCIAAGVMISEIRKNSPENSHIVRLMPNLPLLKHEGCTGYFGDQEGYAFVTEIFSKLGILFEAKSESQLDAITGLCGSGPAFVFIFIQALAEGGLKAGLSYKDSLELAIQTVKGSAILLEQELKLHPETHPEVWKNKVTSPGGTTIYGISALEETGFRSSVMEAVFEAYLRAGELGEK